MSARTTNVLVVDGNPAFRRTLQESLETRGYCTDSVRNAEEALRYIRRRSVDLVLLDLDIPDMGGMEACRRIRTSAPRAGIIVFTALDSEDERICAFEAGADGHMTKPFYFGGLMARMRAVLRRVRAGAAPRSVTIRTGELELEVGQRTFRKAGRDIHLSPKEFDLLAFLMQHEDVPVTHSRLLRAVWGPEYGDEPGYLRSFVKTLRKKIEDDPANPEYILTEPWFGYRFRGPSGPAATPPSLVAAQSYPQK